MKWTLGLATVWMICSLTSLAFSQGGMGGGGFGGGQGGAGGGRGQGHNAQMDGSVDRIEQAITGYLTGEEIKSVLTPGEFCEWTLNLKAGQVVVAEARSDAFDPALEVVDDKNKVLANNDDRYPGDQRPLLLWRCEKDGAYALHVRCFHDKSGGQVFVRFVTYDSVLLASDEKVEAKVESNTPFLLRIPMKAGQIKEVFSDAGGDQKYTIVRCSQLIAPDGLPDINLSQSIQAVTQNSLLMAPVDGDYYYMATAYGSGRQSSKIHVWTRQLSAAKLEKKGSDYAAIATTWLPGLWELTVKTGELLTVSAPELNLNSTLVVTTEPDVSKFDMAKPETNPFFPHPNRAIVDDLSIFSILPARAGDGRLTVLYARKDAKLWVATNGAGIPRTQYTLKVQPTAHSYAEGTSNTAKLRIADTDYWAFDSKSGDVLSFDCSSTGFVHSILLRDPDLGEIERIEAGIDQSKTNWRLTVQKPGRYLLAISCEGNGGGGSYSLGRKVLHAKEFSKTTNAKGDIGLGEVQVWKFTALPNDPLLVHWNSSNWQYDVNIYDDKGRPADFQRQEIDGNNRFGLIKVQRPETFVLVLTGRTSKSTYSIDLNNIPGYKPTSK